MYKKLYTSGKEKKLGNRIRPIPAVGEDMGPHPNFPIPI
jgi:hypothetical protein